MWKLTARTLLALVFASAVQFSGCARADPPQVRFDIAGQPAASGLNEFARQADIALIFSYDRVAGLQTQAVEGRHTVGEGLRRLLERTGMQYRQIGDDAYVVCPGESGCEGSGGEPAENFE